MSEDEIDRLEQRVAELEEECKRYQQNAAISQEESVKHLDRIADLKETNRALKRVTRGWRQDARRWQRLINELSMSEFIKFFEAVDQGKDPNKLIDTIGVHE